MTDSVPKAPTGLQRVRPPSPLSRNGRLSSSPQTMRRHFGVVSTLFLLVLTLFSAQVSADMQAARRADSPAGELADADPSTSASSSTSSSTTHTTSTSTTTHTSSTLAPTPKTTKAPLPAPTQSPTHTTHSTTQQAPPATASSSTHTPSTESSTSTTSTSSTSSTTTITFTPLSLSQASASLPSFGLTLLSSTGPSATTLSLQAIIPSPTTLTTSTGSSSGDAQATADSNAASKSFFDNKGAVIGTFVPVSLVAAGLLVFVVFILRRAHKHQKLRKDEEEFYQEQRNFGFGDENSFSKVEEGGAAGGEMSMIPSTPPGPQIMVDSADNSPNMYSQPYPRPVETATGYFPAERAYASHPYASNAPAVPAQAPPANYNPYADHHNVVDQNDADAYGGATVEDRTSQYVAHDSDGSHYSHPEPCPQVQRSDYPYSTQVESNNRESTYEHLESSAGDHSVGTAY